MFGKYGGMNPRKIIATNNVLYQKKLPGIPLNLITNFVNNQDTITDYEIKSNVINDKVISIDALNNKKEYMEAECNINAFDFKNIINKY